jgi:hypothetical protein
MKVPLVLGALLLAAFTGVMIGRAATDRNSAEPVDLAGRSLESPEAGDQPVADRGGSCADEETLRRIIREELSARLATSPGSADTSGSAAAPDPSHSADNSRQLAAVSEQLDQHIAAGSISDADMAALQMEIGKLDKNGQRHVLSKLMKALNSGALQGRP